MTKRHPPPRIFCTVHPGAELVDVSVPDPPNSAPRLEQACRVCEPTLILIDVVAQLWGRPGDWPEKIAVQPRPCRCGHLDCNLCNWALGFAQEQLESKPKGAA